MIPAAINASLVGASHEKGPGPLLKSDNCAFSMAALKVLRLDCVLRYASRSGSVTVASSFLQEEKRKTAAHGRGFTSTFNWSR